MIKTISKALVIAVTFSSCHFDRKSDIVDNDIKQTTSTSSPVQSNPVSNTNEKSYTTDQKEDSFIGKTTVEIEKMGWFDCAGRMIESKGQLTDYAVSMIAKSQKECMDGAGMIFLERFITRTENKAVFEILDEIEIQSSYPEDSYGWEPCKLSGDEALHVIHYKGQRQSDSIKIHELWAVDLVAGKFRKVKNTKGFTCHDSDMDGL